MQSCKFSELLDDAVNRYTNRSLTTAQITAELVRLAKDMRDQSRRHENLGLSEQEAAFYDAIVQSEAAVLQMGDETLKKMQPSWSHLFVRAQRSTGTSRNLCGPAIRVRVRRLLAKYDYPPDLEEKAVELVLAQAELFGQDAA